MDADRFDKLTRSLAAPVNRRRALKGIAAVLLGTVAGRGRPALGSAQTTCPPNQYPDGTQCRCLLTGEPPHRKTGECRCGSGLTDCQGACIDTNRDPAHCGACGQTCGGTCRKGECRCDSGLTACNGACVALSTDPANCGACGQTCQPGQRCDAGTCISTDPCATLTCDDGNPCTADRCEAGACLHDPIPGCCTGSSQCSKPDDDPCQLRTCISNVCGFAQADPGTPCGLERECIAGNVHPRGACDAAGVCIPSQTVIQHCAPYECINGTCLDTCTIDTGCATGHRCTPSRECVPACTVDADCAPELFCEDGFCRGDKEPGKDCTGPAECLSGVCHNGTCCDTTCDAECHTCDRTTGGLCTAVTGPVCGATDACHIPSTCQAGACTPGDPIVCPISLDECYDVTCDAIDGCIQVNKDDGTACHSAPPCGGAGTCQSGACTLPPGAVCCSGDFDCEGDPCLTGVCDPDTFHCVATANGAACDHPDICVRGSTCQAGTCAGGTRSECIPCTTCNPNRESFVLCLPDPSQNGATCDDDNPCVLTSACQNGTCTREPQPRFTPCDTGSLCTENDVCIDGVCTGSPVCGPSPFAPCHDITPCDPATGTCQITQRPDDTPCTPPLPVGDACLHNFHCEAGSCVGDRTVCDPVALGLSPCQDAVCDGNGDCIAVDKPLNAPCEDGIACTQDTVCVRPNANSPLTCAGRSWTCSMFACVIPFTATDGETYYVPISDTFLCQDEARCIGPGVSGLCYGGVCQGPSHPDGTPCVGSNPGPCVEPGVCQAGTCVDTGLVPNGTPCDTGNICIEGTICTAGACVGGQPVKRLRCDDDEDCCPDTYCRASLIGGTCVTCADLEGDRCDPVGGGECCPTQECICTNFNDCTNVIFRCTTP